MCRRSPPPPGRIGAAAVDDDAAVLTTYFRERHHADGGPPSGALIDLYERRAIAAGVLLRGIERYSLGRPPASEHAIPRSDDPPLTAVAVDIRPRIEAVLDEMAGLNLTPLMALEHARLLSGDIEPLRLGESSPTATRLTLFCGHADRVYLVPAFEAACELLYRRGVAGATVLSGIDGTLGGRRRRAPFLRHGGDAPLMVVAVGSGERIGTLLPELGALFRHPLMTVAAVRLCKRDGQLVSRPEVVTAADATTAPAGMEPRIRLTLYVSEAARHDGQPVHNAIVRRLRSAGLGWVTSHRGIWGFQGEHAPHGDHFRPNGRHVPVVTTVIDTPERIAIAFDVIDSLTPDRGLVTAETVLAPQPSAISSDHLQ